MDLVLLQIRMASVRVYALRDYLERGGDLWTSISLRPPHFPLPEDYLHVKNDYFQISPYSNYIRWSLYSVLSGCCCGVLGTWGVGWIAVVLGFSQTAIPVPQFPEAQQASRSIRGNGAVLTSATLLLRLIPYTEVKGWGLRWGKEWKEETMPLQCHCWPAFL